MIRTSQTADLFADTSHAAPKQASKEVNELHIPLVAMLRHALKPDVLMRHYASSYSEEGARLKAMGKLAGSPDLEFLWRDPNGELRILFLELKRPGAKLSESQLAFMERVKRLGPYCVATTIDEAFAALRTCGLVAPRSHKMEAA
jgi:hypothetical protein